MQEFDFLEELTEAAVNALENLPGHSLLSTAKPIYKVLKRTSNIGGHLFFGIVNVVNGVMWVSCSQCGFCANEAMRREFPDYLVPPCR